MRAAARLEMHAFLFRFLELLVALRRAENRHLLEILERDERDLGRSAAQRGPGGVERLLETRVRFAGFLLEGVDVRLAPHAERRACRVERDESAADDDDAPPEVHPEAAVDVQEVVDGLHDAVQLDARDLQVPPLRNADGKEDGLVAFGPELRKPIGRSQRRPEPERDAEGEDPVDLGLDERPREAVLRNAESHHPARLPRRLEDGDGVAEEREVVGGGKAGWAGADDSDFSGREHRGIS